MYRRTLTITVDQTNENLHDFPAHVEATHHALRSVTHGGHVSDEQAGDIYFTSVEGGRLAHQVISYDAKSGSLSARISTPLVSASGETVVQLHYGGEVLSSSKGDPKSRTVWEMSAGSESTTTTHPSEVLEATELTVEAWVTSDRLEPEIIQSIVSQWDPLESFDTFSAFDAGNTDCLKSTAYFGAVFDGRYIYFAPQHYEAHESHGIVLRYDTHLPFKDPDSYSAYDAGDTDGLCTQGYYGAIFDGRYVYFVPRQDTQEYHSRVLRYDTHSGFKDPESWSAYDLGEPNSHQGVAFDGRYIYFSPGYSGDPRVESGYTGRVIRCDTQADFKDPDTWSVFDANAITGLNATCFDGAGFDGRYIYFAPLLHGIALQYDTKGDFHDPASWSVFNGQEKGLSMCVGTVFDGHHIYFVPYSHPTVVRFDIRGEFEDEDAWSSYDANGTSGLNTSGFDGGFFDGKFVYFIPFVGPPMGPRDDGSQGYTFHGNFLRYNPSNPFDNKDSWEASDSSNVDGLHSVGYNGGAYDGRYFYLAPWRDGTGEGGMHGRILRYDTVGSGAAFDLRFSDCGQNGGLCAAVRGPTFLINTVNGPISVSVNAPLTAGRHHLAGVYNGKSIRLFVDGILAAERTGSGNLHIDPSSIVGADNPGGYGNFRGVTKWATVATTSRSDDWIKASYCNLMNPSETIELGPEEAT